jgi:hypothetical protein
MQPSKQFRAILTQFVGRTQTVRMALARDPTGAPQRLSQAIADAVARHDAEWEQNLVNSWGTLDSPELKQVCGAINTQDQSTLRRFAERVGSEAQSRNEPVLKGAGVEVLDAVWTQTTGRGAAP